VWRESRSFASWRDSDDDDDARFLEIRAHPRKANNSCFVKRVVVALFLHTHTHTHKINKHSLVVSIVSFIIVSLLLLHVLLCVKSSSCDLEEKKDRGTAKKDDCDICPIFSPLTKKEHFNRQKIITFSRALFCHREREREREDILRRLSSSIHTHLL